MLPGRGVGLHRLSGGAQAVLARIVTIPSAQGAIIALELAAA